ncbi:MAG: adenosylmethionine--8-amino-7-oxononanoate transaminase [Planctomycetota bacterium]|nr:adenosylmethionine--8-amino-7-oxononanoate transaminase [Planctomycetota bacterium]
MNHSGEDNFNTRYGGTTGEIAVFTDSSRASNLQPPQDQDAPHWQQLGYQHIWMPYCQMQTSPLPLPVVATDEVYLFLADGTRLIDGMASWWTACHGYNHPHILDAMRDQLTKMPHVMFGGINHEPALTLAARLADLAPGNLNRVFFSDSGSVAVEVALKMAVQFWRNRGVEGRHKFVAFQHAYHGDTTGCMSVCDPVNSMHSHFKGFLLEQYSHAVPETANQLKQLESLLAAKQSEIAGVIVEPLVQGAGGMKFHSATALADIRRLCDKFNLLLIADEIATGFGRTGSMFACEQADVVPDIMCVGKSLTAGVLGLAATIATDHVFAAFQSDDPTHALMHGPTFMANPLACAAANASLDLFESEPRLEQVRVIEDALQNQLEPCRTIDQVVDVRVKGAVGVVQVRDLHHIEELRASFVREGVWLRPFGDMIYLTPPLTISPEQLTDLCDAIVRVVRTWSNW